RARDRRERDHAVRARRAVARPDDRCDHRSGVVLRSTPGAARDLRRARPPQGRSRGAHGLHPPEGRHRHQARAQHDLHRCDGPVGTCLWQFDGRPEGGLRQAARPRRAHRNGVLRGRSRGGACGHRRRGRQREARDRHGTQGDGTRGGRAGARRGRRLRASRRGRPAPRGVTPILAVGVMSGTSLDGVSTALVQLTDDPLEARLVAFRQDAYAAAERGQIIEAIARGGSRDLALLHVALGERFAGAVLQLLAAAKVAPREVAFVASHGQTVWHEPGRATLQLGDPAVIAERVGVRVVSDFRARDVAAGGQGAPLVPLADVLLFGHPERGRLLVKRGGGSDNDAVATATALTVETIARGIERWIRAGPEDELVMSGGGARNPWLVEQLAARVAPRPLVPFERLFFDGEAKEALAFAFLGFLTTLGKPGNLPPATGARGPRVLGRITPA